MSTCAWPEALASRKLRSVSAGPRTPRTGTQPLLDSLEPLISTLTGPTFVDATPAARTSPSPPPATSPTKPPGASARASRETTPVKAPAP
jgi:hypothetical protein